MYHISSDKRAYKSAALIGEGVIELLGDKKLIDISISMINRKTGVSRATFYRCLTVWKM